MHTRLLGALGALLIIATPLLGQAPSPTPVADSSSPVFQAAPLVAQVPAPPPMPTPNQAPPPGATVYQAPPDYVPTLPPERMRVASSEPYHIWVRGELLAWWVKNAPLPAPIAVVTDAAGNSQTVIGSSSANFGEITGGRVALGAWFDDHNNYGFETSFFSLDRRSNNQSVASDGNGNPSIGLSYLSATPGQSGEFIQFLSTPGTFSGNILVSSTLELWGAEVSGAMCLLRTGGFEFTALAGFRYAELRENLNIIGGSTNINSGDFLVLNDQFATRNQFYGGQLGARVNWQGERFALDVTGKLALGATHQIVDIQGNSLDSTNGLLPGGFYAQPSNIGHYTATQFGIIPSLELKLSYLLSQRWRLFVGYDFMYWNQLVRPGNQLDRNVNLTQSPLLGNGALTGPASPTAPLFSRSDFWAQGMTFGFEFRF